MRSLIFRRFQKVHLSCSRAYAAANLVRKSPSESVITRFKEKIDRLNEKLVETEKQLLIEHQKTVPNRLSIIESLERAICKPGKSQLVTVGSLSTQLIADSSSDIDLSFLPEDKEFIGNFHKYPDFRNVFMRTIIDQIRHLAESDPNFALEKDIFPLIYTRVPLLVVEFKNGVTVDIQFPNIDYHSIRNTNLVRHYAAADVRFRQLYMWLRTLFIRLGVKNSKEGLLSSYHIILLVIHFLQSKTTPSVLPVLPKTHDHLVGPEIPLNKVLESLKKPFDQLIDWRSENKLTPAELSIELINYYTDFNPHQYAISIGKGCTFSRKQFPTDTQLLLYDPFSARTVAYSFDIPDALTTVSTYIKRGQCIGEFIDSFPDFPEASSFRYSIRNKEFRPT